MSKKKNESELDNATQVADGQDENGACNEPEAGSAQAEVAPGRDVSAELEACRESLLRIAAEYDNFRKRTAREREALFGTVTAETVLLFLPILDNLDRAAAAPTADAQYAQGVVMISKQFTDILAKMGVAEIEALGKPFDSALHNAVMHVEQEGVGASEIVEVFQKGYVMGDRVIRHSMVKVAN